MNNASYFPTIAMTVGVLVMPFGCSFILHLIQSNCEPQPKDEVIFPLSQHRLLLPLLGTQMSLFMSACSYTRVNKT